MDIEVFVRNVVQNQFLPIYKKDCGMRLLNTPLDAGYGLVIALESILGMALFLMDGMLCDLSTDWFMNGKLDQFLTVFVYSIIVIILSV